VASDATADPAPPLPPADLPGRRLPIDERVAGAIWWRLHLLAHQPQFFGPLPGTPPKNRFDAPDGSFRVCYVGASEEASFVEAFLRDRFDGLFYEVDLEPRAISQLENKEALRLVQLHSEGLYKIGATAAVASGRHDLSRAWSLALHNHPERPDGISYRARHDDSVICAAVYERARAKLLTRSTEPILQDLGRLRRLSQRYGVAIVTADGALLT
jgi:RES domain